MVDGAYRVLNLLLAFSNVFKTVFNSAVAVDYCCVVLIPRNIWFEFQHTIDSWPASWKRLK